MTDYSNHQPRSSWAITLSVWKALFLREAVTRITSSRIAWIWLFLEPIVHFAFMMFMMTVVHSRTIGGLDTAEWLIIGLMSFFMFKRVSAQTKNAIKVNMALYTYRQVQPIDTIFVRAYLEGFLGILLTIMLSVGAVLFGVDMVIDDPLMVMAAFLGLWLMGLGWGLMLSVLDFFLPDISKVVDMLSTPLYILSGVMMPIAAIPEPYRRWIELNPLAHGVEASRLGVSSFYHAMPGLDLAYLYKFAFAMIFFGLLLQRHYRFQLVAK